MDHGEAGGGVGTQTPNSICRPTPGLGPSVVSDSVTP